MNTYRAGLWLKALSVMFVLAGMSVSAGDKTVEKTFDLNQGGVLRINVEGAEVNITPGSGDKVTMVAVVPQSYQLKYESENNELLIEGKKKKRKKFWGFNWSSDSGSFDLTVPAECELRVNTSGGTIEVERVAGSSHRLNTSGGSITADGLQGELEANTSGGNIKVRDSNGGKSLKTSGGNVMVSDSTGDVLARTSGGSIKMDRVTGEIDAKTSGGNVTIKMDGPNQGIVARTSGGSIRVSGPQNLKADLDAKTSGGGVTCNYPVTQMGKIDDDKVRGTLNGGGPKIKLSTSGGSIRIGPQ